MTEFDMTPEEEREYMLSRDRLLLFIHFEDKQFAKAKAKSEFNAARRKK